MQVKDQIHNMLDRLCKPYWTPLHPSLYMNQIVDNNMGQFNLYWVLCGKKPAPYLIVDFDKDLWIQVGRLCKQPMLGGTLGEVTCLTTPAIFYSEIVEPWQCQNLGRVASKEVWRKAFNA